MKKVIPVLLILLLLGGVCFQIFGEAAKRKHLVAPNVGDLIPKEIPGWTVIDKPIAESPDLQKTVEEVLNYDSAVFRIYRKGNTEIAVYMAYWLPGKIDPSLIDGHTPDICWVANGWTMQSLSPLADEHIGSLTVPVPNHRRFRAGDQDLTVLYWHINGDRFRQSHSVRVSRLSTYATIKRRLKQIWHDITQPPNQQLFVRISSNRKIQDELDTEPVKGSLNVLAKAINGEAFYNTGK